MTKDHFTFYTDQPTAASAERDDPEHVEHEPERPSSHEELASHDPTASGYD